MQELSRGGAAGKKKQEDLKNSEDIENKSLMIHLIAGVWMKEKLQGSFLSFCIVQLGHSTHGDR